MALDAYNLLDYNNINNSLKSLTLLATLKSNHSLVNDSLKKLKVSLQSEKNKIERRTNKITTTEISESNMKILDKNIETAIAIVKESFGKIKNMNYEELFSYAVEFIPNSNIRPTHYIVLTTKRMLTVKDLIHSTLRYKQLSSKEMTLIRNSIKTCQDAMTVINTRMSEIINNDQIISSSNRMVIEIAVKMTERINNTVELSMEIMEERKKLSEFM